MLGVVTLGIGMAEVPLDSLTHQAGQDLVGVTDEAFQPAHVSMWLAPAPVGQPELPS